MPSTLVKTLVAIVGVVTFGALLLIIYNQYQIKNQQTAIQTQVVNQQQLVDGIVRSQNQYATSTDLAKFASDNNINLKAIQDNLSQLSAKVSSINVITASSQGQVGTNIASTSTGPKNTNPQPVDPSNPDPFGYMKVQQNLALNEDFGTVKVPFGTVGFSAWQQAPWDINISPRTYQVDTVVGTDDNERQYFYNKFTMQVDGKSYDVPIKTGTTKQEYPTPSWSWWNPRILMGIDGGLNITKMKGELTPSVSLGIMSYGQYKTTPDFSILEVGVGYGAINKTGQLVVTPVAYNIGKNLFSPLMNNTYIGPSFQVGTDGSIGVGAGLRVGF